MKFLWVGAIVSTVVAKASRLDQVMVERGLAESREKSQRLIRAGKVSINHHPAHKPSDAVRAEDHIEVKAPEQFVSRAGYKLEAALKAFQIPIEGRRALDLGASTGGFTDCLLQAGAAHVFAVDVGTAQLAWKLRQDDRVTVMDKTNARFLTPSSFEQPFIPFDLIVVDCSFISLKQILPVIPALAAPQAHLIPLIKPQFEAGKAEVDKGKGVIRDPAIHQQILEDLQNFTQTLPSVTWVDHLESPLLGPAGNKEFLAYLKIQKDPVSS